MGRKDFSDTEPVNAEFQKIMDRNRNRTFVKILAGPDNKLRRILLFIR